MAPIIATPVAAAIQPIRRLRDRNDDEERIGSSSTHRLQDAFALSTHTYSVEHNCMLPYPNGETDPKTTFLMLEEGRLIFDGSLHELIHSDNKFVQEFLL